MDTELDLWSSEWQQATPPPPDLRRQVERHSRWMRTMRALEILITVAFGGGAALWLWRSPHLDVAVLAIYIWAALAVAWRVSLRLTRGLWTPAAESNSEFLDLSIRRCQSQLKAARAQVALYLCNLAFTLTWVYRDSSPRLRLSEMLAITGAISLGLLALLLWHRRVKRAELARLLALRDLLTEPPTR